MLNRTQRGTRLDIILNSLQTEWQGFLAAIPRITVVIIVLIASWIIGRIFSHGLKAVLTRSSLADTHRDFFGRVLVWAFILIGASISLTLIGLNGAAKGLLAGGGATAIVLGFAFREIVENFLAGFFLAFKPPFRLGDLIATGGLEGVVKEVALRSTHIRSFDGRDIFVPSSQIFKSPLINYTMDGLRRHEFTIGIAYTDDADAACELLDKAIQSSGLALANPPPFVGITSFATSYVELTVQIWIDTFSPIPGVVSQRSAVMALCRRVLLDAGHTVSADVSQAIELIDNKKIS